MQGPDSLGAPPPPPPNAAPNVAPPPTSAPPPNKGASAAPPPPNKGAPAAPPLPPPRSTGPPRTTARGNFRAKQAARGAGFFDQELALLEDRKKNMDALHALETEVPEDDARLIVHADEEVVVTVGAPDLQGRRWA